MWYHTYYLNLWYHKLNDNKMSKLNPKSKEFTEKIGKQRYISEIADIWYQCYWEKITYSEFWKKYVNWE